MANRRNSEIVRLFRFVRPRRTAFLLGLIGCSLADASVPIVMALVLRRVLDAITEKSMSTVWTVGLQFAAMIVGLLVITPLVHYGFGKTVKQTMADMRQAVFHHMEKLPVAYYENTHSGDSISRINNDVGAVESVFAGDIRRILTLVTTGVYSATLMCYLDWRFASAMIVLGFFSTYVNTRYAKPLRRISAEIQQNAARQVERLSDLISGAQIGRMFHMLDRMVQRFRDENHLWAKCRFAARSGPPC
jgi:ABC-type multidrug transport system fused ATPase/permease subunit